MWSPALISLLLISFEARLRALVLTLSILFETKLRALAVVVLNGEQQKDELLCCTEQERAGVEKSNEAYKIFSKTWRSLLETCC
ncbi:hypothetical protein L1887_41849 [Cichorium endivia]|nr:hypothetical protein L1887_41849 [Cichorium endivia]